MDMCNVPLLELAFYGLFVEKEALISLHCILLSALSIQAIQFVTHISTA